MAGCDIASLLKVKLKNIIISDISQPNNYQKGKYYYKILNIISTFIKDINFELYLSSINSNLSINNFKHLEI